MVQVSLNVEAQDPDVPGAWVVQICFSSGAQAQRCLGLEGFKLVSMLKPKARG